MQPSSSDTTTTNRRAAASLPKKPSAENTNLDKRIQSKKQVAIHSNRAATATANNRTPFADKTNCQPRDGGGGGGGSGGGVTKHNAAAVVVTSSSRKKKRKPWWKDHHESKTKPEWIRSAEKKMGRDAFVEMATPKHSNVTTTTTTTRVVVQSSSSTNHDFCRRLPRWPEPRKTNIEFQNVRTTTYWRSRRLPEQAQFAHATVAEYYHHDDERCCSPLLWNDKGSSSCIWDFAEIRDLPATQVYDDNNNDEPSSSSPIIWKTVEEQEARVKHRSTFSETIKERREIFDKKAAEAALMYQSFEQTEQARRRALSTNRPSSANDDAAMPSLPSEKPASSIVVVQQSHDDGCGGQQRNRRRPPSANDAAMPSKQSTVAMQHGKQQQRIVEYEGPPPPPDDLPDGLTWPPGWKKQVVVRQSGATAGSSRDSYWYPPPGRGGETKLRSKKDVVKFLKQGEKTAACSKAAAARKQEARRYGWDPYSEEEHYDSPVKELSSGQKNEAFSRYGWSPCDDDDEDCDDAGDDDYLIDKPMCKRSTPVPKKRLRFTTMEQRSKRSEEAGHHRDGLDQTSTSVQVGNIQSRGAASQWGNSTMVPPSAADPRSDDPLIQPNQAELGDRLGYLHIPQGVEFEFHGQPIGYRKKLARVYYLEATIRTPAMARPVTVRVGDIVRLDNDEFRIGSLFQAVETFISEYVNYDDWWEVCTRGHAYMELCQNGELDVDIPQWLPNPELCVERVRRPNDGKSPFQVLEELSAGQWPALLKGTPKSIADELDFDDEVPQPASFSKKPRVKLAAIFKQRRAAEAR